MSLRGVPPPSINGHANLWADERNVDTLKRLWTEGKSGTEIARMIGAVSRNAVVAKVHRLGLARRGATNGRPQAPVRQTPSAPGRVNGKGFYGHERPAQPPAGVVLVQVKPANGIAPPKLVVVETKPRPKPRGKGKTIMELGFNDCRFIVSGSGYEALYCSAPKREVGEHEAPCPYCFHHWNLLRPKGDFRGSNERELTRSLRRFI